MAIHAGGFAVKQASTGDLLLSDHSTQPFEAGQFIDLMTLYTVLSDPAYAAGTQVLWQGGLELHPRYEEGTAVTTDDALHLLLYEGNAAAAAALAETYGPGREAFVQKMNQNAQALGMTSTSYHSCLSFQEGQTTTAEDTLKLVEKLAGLDAFNAMVDKSAYTVSVPTKTGQQSFENPAHLMQQLTADGVEKLRYYRLTSSEDDGVMAAAVGKTAQGETLYAVTFDATATEPGLEDEWLGAHILRTFIEEGAAQVGAGGENPSETTTQTQVVAPVETTVQVTQPTTTPAIMTEGEEDKEGLGWLFYLVLAILILALIGLAVATILGARKRAQRERRRRDPYGYDPYDGYADDNYYDDGYDDGYYDDGYADDGYYDDASTDAYPPYNDDPNRWRN